MNYAGCGYAFETGEVRVATAAERFLRRLPGTGT
jgi:hypothetical protein